MNNKATRCGVYTSARVVDELTRKLTELQRLAQEGGVKDGNEISSLRSALAASRAEVEGFKSLLMDAVDYRFTNDQKFRKETTAAIDAAMEKGND